MEMEEYLKTVNLSAISCHNISCYVKKKEGFACVLDVMALVMDREPWRLIPTLKYMIEHYQCNYKNISFSDEEHEIGMKVDDLIPFLCHIPGRDCKYRLYKYSDVLLKYLDGNQFWINYIIENREKEDSLIWNTIKRTSIHEDYRSKIKKIRDFELFVKDNITFPDNYTASSEFYNEIDVIRKEFYSQKIAKDNQKCINELRHQEINKFAYVENANKLKTTDEISFNQVIYDLGYQDDFFKRIKCFEYGSEMKEKKGHKMINKKGESVYIYTREDLDDMIQIVHRVYSEI
tara:strand:+ start:83 stop:952 length:870 start_codon:yes stop_codon:yes gene_type:complete